jgi:O-antigen biosynthesis protein
MVNPPYASVILPTRDRPDQVAIAIRAILANTFRDIELVVVDQSAADTTTTLVKNIAARDPRLRLVRDAPLGSSHARNRGIAATEGQLAVFTDDDCVVASDWLAQIVAACRANPGTGAVCGSVLPAQHDPSAGFIVGFVPTTPDRLTGRLAKLRDGGIGANLAIRRQALEHIGGWDELLGAGSPFQGAGDRDLIYRVLAAGYALQHLPEARAVHHGFRNWKSGGPVIRGRFRGIGAAYTKHLRLRDPVALLLLIQALVQASANIVMSMITGRRPVGVGRMLALFSGIWGSFAYKVDPRTKRYQPRVGQQP